MIFTLTPNPSIDRAFTVPNFGVGKVNRANEMRTDAGGKGINISRALHAHSIHAPAIFPAGGPGGVLLSELLAQSGIASVPVNVDGETRTNITLSHGAGDQQDTTKVNAPGPTLTTSEAQALVGAMTSRVKQGDVVIGAGSLPAGLSSDFYAQTARLIADLGATFILDTSGQALVDSVSQARPGTIALIKPNLEELIQITGRELESVGDVVDAATDVCRRGISGVLVSLGEDGMILVHCDSHRVQAPDQPDCLDGGVSVIWAGAPRATAVSTVGAGDIALAGFMACTGGVEEKLAWAAAWGAAAVQLPGTAVPSPEMIKLGAVRIKRSLDPQAKISALNE